MGALHAGLQTARGDAIVLMDGDLQDPPDVLPQMIADGERRAGGDRGQKSRKESRKALALLFPCSIV